MSAYGSHITCENLQVVGCGENGVFAYGGTITLSGQGTEIQGNVKVGWAEKSTDKIILVAPLTIKKEERNWGGGGTIEQIDNDGVVLQILYKGENEELSEGDY